MPKLTKRTIDATEPQLVEFFIWDESIPGFGVRVMPSGRKSFVVQYRAGRRPRRMNVENETPVDTAILLYRGKALAKLGLPDAAIDVLTLANRRHKDRPEVLMRQIRYDRAVLYDQVSRKAQARREFERLYAADPNYEDVAERLELIA